jgi:hypothetical protein
LHKAKATRIVFNEEELWNSCACMRALHDEKPDGVKVNDCGPRGHTTPPGTM